MTRKLTRFLRRFRRCEDGNATVEFVIVFPAIVGVMLAAVELTFMTLNHAMLERAVDIVVRDLRLNTGSNPGHDQLKVDICEKAVFIRNCSTNLKLEMIRQDPYVGITIPLQPDCTDLSEEVRPVRQFENGQANELMVLRACAKINPIFPSSTLGATLANAEGQYALTAMSVFVQEPL
ncbi:TadE/TadG family type IV pilus assembly protein [Ruegeria marina]|uniref:TadE-like protein n=1 Tax=Ruegeria marina TaxID=639004 RepID=A0A1G6XBB3_9RHOB|nr:TadE family protein [Ruegeria marina]SDD75448.1 TadE-like protein [Ruegeria marina]